jgi:hypothetical protein
MLKLALRSSISSSSASSPLAARPAKVCWALCATSSLPLDRTTILPTRMGCSATVACSARSAGDGTWTTTDGDGDPLMAGRRRPRLRGSSPVALFEVPPFDVLAAVTNFGRTLRHDPAELQAEKEEVLAAVAKDRRVLRFTSMERKGDYEVVRSSPRKMLLIFNLSRVPL